ncbi:SMP-30/gluconolactonase/LRE family protein [Pseudomonas sp. UL073]|uniref:SMP-30/gluconolactonase/LRE family protein n=1 Tax=Zestomonas insulae TaxID=2809017 RepID=A0ABS2I8J2_9GAMM|nr:SMP-30/gluconolactonase/LRE family protein [Pseudomonas insulae]MBM7059305.1 SMP-30/gluconolactonase/LRE family protein [Pseudomonas insulae]
MLRLQLPLLAGLLCAASAALAEIVPPCVAPPGTTPLCGIAPAEDIEAASDGRFLFLSTTPGLSDAHHSRLRQLELASGAVRDLPVEIDAEPGWGDRYCAAPPQAIGAHGLHLSRRADGREQLLVVNHQGREAIEFLEPVAVSGGWKAVWRGCVANSQGSLFNDVVGSVDGGFVATAMFELRDMQADPHLEHMLDGRDTGYLMAWWPGATLVRLAHSKAPFPNGIQRSADGRSVWFAAWTGKALWQYDLASHQVTRKVALDFMPDNLSWSADGRLLAAGLPDAATFRDCFVGKREFCPSAVRVVALDPQDGTLAPLYTAAPGVLFGASVALQVGPDLYVGAFTGDRLLRVPDAFAER